MPQRQQRTKFCATIESVERQPATISERDSQMVSKFTAVFEQEGDWWMGYVEELPGANTQGATLEETRENLKEAIQLIIEANRELAQRESEGKPVIREELLVTV